MAWCAFSKSTGLKRHSAGAFQSVLANVDGSAVPFCEPHALACTACGTRAATLIEIDKRVGAGAMHPVVVLCRSCLFDRFYFDEGGSLRL